MNTDLTLSEKLWVYNIFWACPAAIVLLSVLATFSDWTGRVSVLANLIDVAVVGGIAAAVVYLFCGWFQRSDRHSAGLSWADRKSLARGSRPYRSRQLRQRGYAVQARPDNQVAVVAIGDTDDRAVPHFWPISLGFEPVRTGSNMTTFADDQEDAIIEHINRLREGSSREPIDSRTVALAKALNR